MHGGVVLFNLENKVTLNLTSMTREQRMSKVYNLHQLADKQWAVLYGTWEQVWRGINDLNFDYPAKPFRKIRKRLFEKIENKIANRCIFQSDRLYDIPAYPANRNKAKKLKLKGH